MKKLFCVLLTTLIVFSGCTKKETPPSSSAPDPSESTDSTQDSEPQVTAMDSTVADDFLRTLIEGDYQSAFDLCAEELQSAVGSAAGLDDTWKQLLSVAGEYISHEESYTESNVSNYPADFEQGRYVLQVVETGGKVSGFFLRPHLGFAEQYLDTFLSGEDDQWVFDHADKTMQGVLSSVDGVAATREQLQMTIGALLDKAGPSVTVQGNSVIYRYIGTFENGMFDVTISIDTENALVNTFAFTPAASANINAEAVENGPPPSDDLPAGVAEEDIVVNKGEAYPLYGKLTYPAETQGSIPVVVLVHGSGANDMDETAYENRPFKDIAYDLSQQGIAVLRYNKMTYAYPEVSSQLTDMTVDQETVHDAVAAKTALEEQSFLQFSGYYVADHSLGGMMAPRIAVSGGYDGMIILAGSLRSLEDIMIEQYRYLIPISGLPEEDAKAMLEEYEASYAEAKRILALPEAEQAGKTAFGSSALYFHSISNPDRTETLADSGLPTLVLQGGKDYQISAEKDFTLYQELAREHDNIQCILYENLNHIFTPSTMEVPDGTEYMTPSHVDARVTDDMVRWLLAQ